MNTVRDSGSKSIAEFRSSCLNNEECGLPSVNSTDFDIPVINNPCFNVQFGETNGPTETTWLVGGNDATELVDADGDGDYEFGIIVPATGPLAGPEAQGNIGFVTADVTRMRLHGAETTQPTQYASMAGKLVAPNVAVGSPYMPVLKNRVTSAGVPQFVDIYLERPSNAYTMSIATTDGVLVTPNVGDPYYDVSFNNIFNGEAPVGYSSLLSTYTSAANSPLSPMELDYVAFEFILKVFNTTGTEIHITFLPNSPPDPPTVPPTKFTRVYPTLNSLPYIIPAGGGAIFKFRADSPTVYYMLTNTIYTGFV